MDAARRKELVRLVGGVAIVAVLVAFVIDNSHRVTVGFVLFEKRVALIWVLLVTAVLGAVADRLLQAAWKRRK